MKKTFAIIALTSVSLLSADQYSQSYGYRQGGNCANCNTDGRNYQDNWRDNQRAKNYDGWTNNHDTQGWYNNQNYNNGRNNGYNRNTQDGRDYQDNRNYQNNDGWRTNRDANGFGNNQNNSGWRNSANDNQMNSDDRNQRDSQNPNSDNEIRKKIHDKLASGWFSKGFDGVLFRVDNGQVSLKGGVDSFDDKKKIEDGIRKIEGVREVNNQIRVVKDVSENNSDSQMQELEKKYPQDYAASPQDRQVNAKIRDKLGSGWFSKGYETLILKTTNGVVVISGSVDKIDDIQKINDQIKDVDGVRSVNNELDVKNK